MKIYSLWKKERKEELFLLDRIDRGLIFWTNTGKIMSLNLDIFMNEKNLHLLFIYYYLFIYIVILRLIEESPMEISTYSIVKYQTCLLSIYRWVYFVSSIIHAQHVTSNFTNSKKSQKTIFCNAKTILWWSLKRGQYLVDILLHYSQIFNHCQIECYSATCVL